jgi:hypothetical protein
MFNKQQLTQQILNQLPADDRPSLEQAMKYWWQDIRDEGGLRLSMSGYDAFTSLNIERHTFEVPPSTPALPRQLIILNKKLDCPYYLSLGKKPKLIIFGSTQAIMYAMYGDLNKFLLYLDRT